MPTFGTATRETLLGFAMLTCFAAGAVSAQNVDKAQLCTRAISDDRMNGLSQQKCECVATVMQSETHPKLYALWNNAMYTGQGADINSLTTVTGLSERALARQMQKAAKQIRRQCKVKF